MPAGTAGGLRPDLAGSKVPHEKENAKQNATPDRCGDGGGFVMGIRGRSSRVGPGKNADYLKSGGIHPAYCRNMMQGYFGGQRLGDASDLSLPQVFRYLYVFLYGFQFAQLIVHYPGCALVSPRCDLFWIILSDSQNRNSRLISPENQAAVYAIFSSANWKLSGSNCNLNLIPFNCNNTAFVIAISCCPGPADYFITSSFQLYGQGINLFFTSYTKCDMCISRASKFFR